jgi:Holliday junction resolvase-like predicted endonuclease
LVFTTAKAFKDFVLKLSRHGVEYVRKRQTPDRATWDNKGGKALLGNNGEGWAKFRLRMKGYKNAIAIQNSSGHGIDLVCRDRRGNIVFVEVKSHFEAAPLKLSKAQSDMERCARTRLEAARDKTGHWKNVDDETSANADSLLKAMDGPPPAPTRGIAINVDHAMTWFKKTTFYEWDRGRYPTNIINP